MKEEDCEHHEFMKKYGKIMEWTDQPRSRYVNDPEYDEYREYHEFIKKYGQIMEQLKSYKIPEARAALIISEVIAIYAGSEKKCEG